MKDTMKLAAKRMAAIIAAGAMAVTPVAGTINIGAMTAMASAQTGTTKKSTDTVSYTIKGLKGGEIVTAYQLIKGVYDTASTADNTLKGYAFVNNAAFQGMSGAKTALADTEAQDPYNTEVQNAIKNLQGETTQTLTKERINAIAADAIKSTGSNYTSYTSQSVGTGVTSVDLNLGAGTYVIVITNPDKASTVYNPIIVSAEYLTENKTITKDDGTKQTIAKDTLYGGSFDAENGTYAYGTAPHAKSSTTTLTKEITNPGTNGNTHGDSLGAGDEQDFQIATQIPAYTTAYSNIKFDIADDQDDTALDLKADSITVYVGADKATLISNIKDGTAIALTKSTDNSKGDYKLIVGTATKTAATETAKAKVTGVSPAVDGEDFKIDFSGLTNSDTFLQNHATQWIVVTYKSTLKSNATSVDGTTFNAHDNDVTRTYSNDVANHTDWDTQTTHDYTFPINIVKRAAGDDTSTLSGAVFELYRYTDANHTPDANWTTKTSLATDEKGLTKFDQLDEGYYGIKEITAPSGYSVDNSIHYVTITPTLSATTGAMENYTIVWDSETAVSNSTDAHTINDTPLSGLPNTGARSALILTIAGVAVMVIVLAASRKKKMAD